MENTIEELKKQIENIQAQIETLENKNSKKRIFTVAISVDCNRLKFNFTDRDSHWEDMGQHNFIYNETPIYARNESHAIDVYKKNVDVANTDFTAYGESYKNQIKKVIIIQTEPYTINTLKEKMFFENFVEYYNENLSGAKGIL